MTAADDQTDNYLYVSWGGSGRTSCLRQAIERAEANDASLRYLAILDDATFSGIDASLRAVVADELTWLLETQIDLARRQTGIDRRVRLQVESGEVGSVSAAVAKATDATLILVGAPVPVSHSQTVVELMAALAATTGSVVELIEP
ncbi:MAG: universal stress protein [Acidimicrobiales bacterium]